MNRLISVGHIAFLLLFFTVLLPSAQAERQSLLSFQDELVSVEAYLENKTESSLHLSIESADLATVSIEEHVTEGLLTLRATQKLFAGNMSLQCPKNPLLERIKLQNDAHGSQIELYFHNREIPSYSWKQQDTQFKIQTTDSASISTQKEQTTAQALNKPLTQPQIIRLKRQLPPTAPELRLKAVPKPAPKHTQLLTGIFFQRDDTEQTSIRLEFSKQPAYQFVKVNDHSYQLTIPEAGFASEHIGLPHFPPGDFPGITHVQAIMQNNAVEVTFGVEAPQRMTPVTKNKTVQINLTTP